MKCSICLTCGVQQPISGDSREVLARGAICLLDVPRTRPALRSPNPLVRCSGQAIEAWRAIRPE
jgi:hypothetical protein